MGTLEIAVLSLLRRKRHYLQYKELLTPEFFSSIESKTIYRMIETYHKKGKTQFLKVADLWLLLEKYIDEDDHSTYRRLLNRLRNIKQDEEAVRMGVVQFAQSAKVRALVQSAAGQVQGKQEIDVHDLRKRIDEIVSLNGIAKDVNYDYFSEVQARLDEDISDGRIPTGLAPAIDASMNGGLGPGEFGFFVAPPKRGKTTTLVNVGANALRIGKRVLHCTLEIQAKHVARRYDCCLTRSTWGDIVDDYRIIPQMRRSLPQGAELVIKDFTHQHCSVARLESIIQKEMELGQRPYDIIIIDFADYMTPPNKYADTRHELNKIYQELRILAGAFKVPVWTASQGNRQSVNKRKVDMDDIAEAFGKAGIADIVISLSQTEDEKYEKEMRLFVAGNRIGPGNPVVRVSFDTDRMYIHDPEAHATESGARKALAHVRKGNEAKDQPVDSGGPRASTNGDRPHKRKRTV